MTQDTPARFLIWTSTPTAKKLIPPVALFDCADPVSSATWRAANRWAADLPRFRFANAAELRAERTRHGTAALRLFDADDGGILGVIAAGEWRDQGVAIARNMLARVAPNAAMRELPEHDPQRINAGVDAARSIAALFNGPVWTLAADESAAVAGVGVAVAHGRAVIVGAGGPGPLAAALSASWGVSMATSIDVEETRRVLERASRGGSVL